MRRGRHGPLTVTGALAVGDAATSRTNLGLGTANDVQHARLGLGQAASTVARLVFVAEVAPKILLYGDTVGARYGLSLVGGALRVHTVSTARLSLGHLSIADGTTYTEQLALHAPGGHVYLGVPSSGPTEAAMLNSQLAIWVNSTTLTFRVKDNAGVMKTATLALT